MHLLLNIIVDGTCSKKKIYIDRQLSLLPTMKQTGDI